METAKTLKTSTVTIVSPRQVAAALGVSESSIKRWCDQGRLTTVRTPGGHRRLALSSVLRFAAESGHAVRDLAALGGEELSERAPRAGLPATYGELRRSLLSGDLPGARAALATAWLGGQSVDAISDELLAPIFAEIGDRWASGALEIYEERRACEITRRALYDLAEQLLPVKPGAPRAIGATRERDPYALPTTLVEVVLRERGYDATTLGTRLPASTLVRAIEDLEPELVWLCVGVCDDPEQLVEECAALERAAQRVGAALVLGGRALVPELRPRLRCAAFCEGMKHLASLADALLRARKRDVPATLALGQGRTRRPRRAAK